MSDTNAPGAPKRALATERRQQALRMRTGGMTYAQIAVNLGITVQRAWQLVDEALLSCRKATAEDAEKMREIELNALNTAQASIWANVLKGDNLAVDRLIKIQARRAALLGLDAPVKTDLTIDAPVTFVIRKADEHAGN